MKYCLPQAKVAEIGAGIGQMAYLMKKVGYDHTGFELSEEICHYAEETLKVKMHQGDIGDVNDKYDMIISFDLLEHILTPNDFIRRCVNHLKKGEALCLILLLLVAVLQDFLLQ